MEHPKIPYLADAIDLESEYADRYINVISHPDKCERMDLHHIVPVSFYADVLGVENCRSAASPDMVTENLVLLSKGHHLLAHYYLSRCARKCISTQMINAFRQMYNGRGKWEDDEVLRASKEIDEYYESLKGQAIPHKDGTEVINRENLVSLARWKDGAKVGVECKMRPNGKLVEIFDHDRRLRVRVEYGRYFQILYYHKDEPKKPVVFEIRYDEDERGHTMSIMDNPLVWGYFSCYYSPTHHYGEDNWIRHRAGYTTNGKEYVGSPEFRRLAKSIIPLMRYYIPLMDFSPDLPVDPKSYTEFMEETKPIKRYIDGLENAEPLEAIPIPKMPGIG